MTNSQIAPAFTLNSLNVALYQLNVSTACFSPSSDEIALGFVGRIFLRFEGNEITIKETETPDLFRITGDTFSLFGGYNNIGLNRSGARIIEQLTKISSRLPEVINMAKSKNKTVEVNDREKVVSFEMTVRNVVRPNVYDYTGTVDITIDGKLYANCFTVEVCNSNPMNRRGKHYISTKTGLVLRDSYKLLLEHLLSK